MTTITVKVNNKTFPVACEDGQEILVENAVNALNARVNALKASSPTAPTEYLLLLSAISMQSEILELQNNEHSFSKEKKLILEQALQQILSMINSVNTELQNLNNKNLA